VVSKIFTLILKRNVNLRKANWHRHADTVLTSVTYKVVLLKQNLKVKGKVVPVLN
jgi:hypothetical protein